MSDIYLLRDFAFVSDPAAIMWTDWVQFPAGFQLAQFVAVVKSREGVSGIDLELETSWDRDSVFLAPVSATTGAPATIVLQVLVNLGPWVRLRLTAVTGTQSQVNLSVYLTPKMR